jgi:O-antigen/teichoic acid export membrane protein
MEVIRQLLTAIAVVALIAVGAGILPLLSVPLAMYLLLVPVVARLARGKITLGMELHPRRWLALLRPTVAYSLATMVGAIYVYTAQILTSLAASAHQSGLFSLSFRVYTVAVTVPMLLVSGAVPLLARAERDDRERLAYALQRIFEVSLILGVAIAIGILAGAPFIVEVVGGPKYAGSVPVLRIQGIALAASFMVAGWGFALLTIKRYRPLLIVNAVALIVSCALTLALATSHGATGAASATRWRCSQATPRCAPAWRCCPRSRSPPRPRSC